MPPIFFQLIEHLIKKYHLIFLKSKIAGRWTSKFHDLAPLFLPTNLHAEEDESSSRGNEAKQKRSFLQLLAIMLLFHFQMLGYLEILDDTMETLEFAANGGDGVEIDVVTF